MNAPQPTNVLAPVWTSTAATPSGLTAEQAPDDGAQRFVTDLLQELFDEDTDRYEESWIPLALMGTLDWIVICNWWAWFYTGIFKSSEPYNYVFRYHDTDDQTGEDLLYEFDPEKLVVFREDRDRNYFEERFINPGLDDRERAEIIQFLLQDVFREMEVEPPPQETLEKIAYATFMWVLSDNGRDWLCEIDPVWDCVDEFRVAYLERWEHTLLDPRKMEKTDRKLGACAFCQNQLYCVAGAVVDSSFAMVCNDCLILTKDQGHEVDMLDARVNNPSCPHLGGSCVNTNCPHNPLTHEDLGDMMAEQGRNRVDMWRSARVASKEARTLAGRTVDQVVEYFQEVDYEEVLHSIMEIAAAGQLKTADEALSQFIYDPNIKDKQLIATAMERLVEVLAELGEDERATEIEYELELLLT